MEPKKKRTKKESFSFQTSLFLLLLLLLLDPFRMTREMSRSQKPRQWAKATQLCKERPHYYYAAARPLQQQQQQQITAAAGTAVRVLGFCQLPRGIHFFGDKTVRHHRRPKTLACESSVYSVKTCTKSRTTVLVVSIGLPRQFCRGLIFSNARASNRIATLARP